MRRQEAVTPRKGSIFVDEIDRKVDQLEDCTVFYAKECLSYLALIENGETGENGENGEMLFIAKYLIAG